MFADLRAGASLTTVAGHGHNLAGAFKRVYYRGFCSGTTRAKIFMVFDFLFHSSSVIASSIAPEMKEIGIF